MLTVTINEEILDNPISIDADRSLDQLAGTFSFTFENSEGIIRDDINELSRPQLIPRGPSQIAGQEFLREIGVLPAAGDLVRIYADDYLWLTGYIEKIEITYDIKNHIVTCTGRSLPADLIDSKVDGGDIVVLNPPITLRDITNKILEFAGLSDRIKAIVDPRITIEPFQLNELIAGEIGQSYFEFLLEYAKKRQVLLTSNAVGNLVYTNLTFPLLTTETALQLKNLTGRQNKDNNISSASAVIDFTNRYSLYRMRAQQGVSTGTESSTPEEITNGVGEAGDPQIRTGRTFVQIMETTADNTQATNRAIWEANTRRAKSFRYTVTVDSHTVHTDPTNVDQESPWTPGIVANIDDEFVTPDTLMVVNTVRMHYSVDDGSSSDVELITPDAYSLNAAEPDSTKKQRKEGALRYIRERPPGVSPRTQKFPVAPVGIDAVDNPKIARAGIDTASDVNPLLGTTE